MLALDFSGTKCRRAWPHPESAAGKPTGWQRDFESDLEIMMGLAQNLLTIAKARWPL